MSKYLIKLDESRCIGCKACEVQCQVKNRTPAAVRPGLLVSTGPACLHDKVRMAAAFRPCFHCEKPWCIAACPTRAIVKREEDGLVHVVNRFKNEKIAGHMTMNKGERSVLAELATNLL